MNFSSALVLYFFAARAIGRSQLAESKMKTNRALLAGFFPRLTPLTRTSLEFSLIYISNSICSFYLKVESTCKTLSSFQLNKF